MVTVGDNVVVFSSSQYGDQAPGRIAGLPNDNGYWLIQMNTANPSPHDLRRYPAGRFKVIAPELDFNHEDTAPVGLSVEDLKRITDFTEALTAMYHDYIAVCPDFDNAEYDVIGGPMDELVGKVAIGNDGEFLFFPGVLS